MDEKQHKSWFVHGVVGIVVTTVLIFFYGVLMKFFVPSAAYRSWRDLVTISLAFGVVYGFLAGVLSRYVLVHRPKSEKVLLVKAAIFVIAFTVLCNLILHRFWEKPKPNENFWLYFAWGHGPYFTALSLLWLMHRKKLH